ncbi:extracellular serine-rich [Fusarium pseudocircinatum]|uniref:Extracellular serine-rich n=1 Tax=Fusarium pseudocircinatum TaxID=56676 RepID=A0A8H5Q1S7_9HYPO|nr:extracellular serine-rich [Fusarium pseudocircinatum]
MYFSQIAIVALAAVAEAVDVQVVSVGRNSATNATGLKFWPEKITAEPGTMVQFQFWAGNHTVTQSTFDDPCVPIGNVMSNVTGIYSGYQPVEASMSKGMIPTYTIMVKDKKPMWLFCSKAKHCQGGMSMVINENTSANATRSLNNYKSLCSSATVSEVVPVQGGGSPQGGNGGNGTNTGGSGGGSSGGGSGDDSSDDGSSSGGDSSDDGSSSGDDSSDDGSSDDGSEDGSGTPTGVSAPGATGTPTAGSSGDPVVTAAAAELKAPISMLLAVGAAAIHNAGNN